MRKEIRILRNTPCYLDCSGRVTVGWRWCQAKRFAGFSWVSLCGRLTAQWCRSLSSSSIQSRILGLTSRSFGRSSAWSLYCTERTYTHCWAFWRRFWPCWEGSWCHSLLLNHALLCCSSVVCRSPPFTGTGLGLDTFSNITSVFFWLIFRPTCYA